MPSLEEQAIMEGVGTDEAIEQGLVLSRLLRNPATRADALRLIKRNNPALNVPEVDIPQSFEAHLKPLLDKVDEMGKQLAETKLEGMRKGRLEDLVEKGLAESVSEAREIEKFAIDEKIADYEKAAKFFRMSQKQAEPTSDLAIMGGPMELPVDFKDIAKNPSRWAQKAAAEAFADYRKTTKH